MGAAITARQTLQKKILQTFLKIPKTTLLLYLTYNPFQNVRHMLQPSKVWGPSSTTVHTFLKRQVLLSMRWRQTPKYCFLFFSNFPLWFHLYMSSCSGRLHYSWQLKHYLGPHKQGCSFDLLFVCTLNFNFFLAVLCFQFSTQYMQMFLPSRMIFNPAGPLCHDAGLTQRSLVCLTLGLKMRDNNALSCIMTSMRGMVHGALVHGAWCF